MRRLCSIISRNDIRKIGSTYVSFHYVCSVTLLTMLIYKIQTNIGELIVSVNPFKTIDIYNEATMKKYNEADLNNNSLPPHIFATATNTYRSMMDSNIPQSVVISGESGSGKTEATKYF